MTPSVPLVRRWDTTAAAAPQNATAGAMDQQTVDKDDFGDRAMIDEDNLDFVMPTARGNRQL